MNKASDFFNLPITGQNIVDEYCGDMRGFKATKQEDFMANCINHADALADALAAITDVAERLAVVAEFDLTLRPEYEKAKSALAAYRGAV